MKTQKAFTLIEILVTLTVAAILAIVALPNMRYMLLSNQITSKTNELIAAINYIRTETLTRNNTIQILPLDDSDANNEWGNGWRIWVDLDNNGLVDANNDIVKVFDFTDDQIVIDQILEDSEDDYTDTTIISYRARGRVQDPYKFFICHKEYPEAREVTIMRVGRAGVQRCSLNNGEPLCQSSCN